MRTQLLAVLGTLLAIVLLALSLPYASRIAGSRQEAMFSDRLQDTNWFASEAQQATDDADQQELRDDLRRYAELFGIAAAIVDRDGSIRDSAGALDLRTPEIHAAVALALSGHASPNPPTIWPGSDRRLVVAVPVIRGGDVVGAALTISPTDRLRATLARDLQIIALVDLAALTVVALLAFRLASWILRPVYRLDEAAHQVGAGRLDTRVSVHRGPVEVRRLGSSFNQMARAVQEAMAKQEAFVADASHQLRNPLTALNLRLEVLAGRATGRDAEEFARILEETGRLNTILRQLLDLAAAHHTLSAAREPVDAVALAADRIASWSLQAAEEDVDLHLSHPPAASALADPALASSVLDAVLHNAIKFSPPGGRVDVAVRDDGATVSVTVTDRGPGLKPAEFDRVGDRFWRSADAQNIPGSGLGLSIARDLTVAMGGTLEFSPVEPHGLRVRLVLPRAASRPVRRRRRVRPVGSPPQAGLPAGSAAGGGG